MKTLSNRWLWSGILISSACAILASYAYQTSYSSMIHYRNYVFPSVIGSLFLLMLTTLIAAACAHAERIWEMGRQSVQKPGILLTCVAIWGVAYGLTPQVPNILFDENIFMSIAQTFSKSGMLAACHHGRLEGGGFSCFAYEYYKQPPGFPFFLAIFYRMFGASESIAAIANLLTLPLAFVAGIVFLRDLGWSQRRSMLAMSLYVTTPLVMHWSGTAALEPFSVSITLVALALLGRWLKTGDAWLSAAAAAAVAWALLGRLESVLPLTGGLLLLWPFFRARHPSIQRSQIVFFLSVLLLFVVPFLLQVYLFRGDPWGASDARFSTKFFLPNLKVNGGFLFKNENFPIWITLTALLALVTVRPRFQVLAIFYWFIASFAIYLFFYAGSYEYGMDARFSIPSSLPLALLSAMFLDRIAEEKSAPALLWVALPLVQLIWFVPVIRNVQMQPQAARDSILFSDTYLKTLPPDSIVFSHVPSVPLLRERNAAIMHFIDNEEPSTRHFFERYSGGVYLDWTYWCATTEEYRKNCQRIVDRYDSEIVQTMTRDRMEFKLIRLRLKSAAKK